MPKTTIKNLVSLILEQIDTQSELDKLFPPDEYIFVENIYDYPELFQPRTQEQPDDKVRQLQPEPEVDDKVRQLQPEPELDMVAESRPPDPTEFNVTMLEEPMMIPVTIMSQKPNSKGKISQIPPIKSLNPITNEFVDEVAIGVELLTTPSGHEVLKFWNYIVEQKAGKAKERERNFIILKDRWQEDKSRIWHELENIWQKNNVRGPHFGLKVIDRNPQGTQQKIIADSKLIIDNPDTTFDEKELATKTLKDAEERLTTIQGANTKRYAIFPSVNQMFDHPDILNKLDISLIPEAWAAQERTESSALVRKTNKLGDSSPEIDIDFISARDFETVDQAMEQSMEMRMQLAGAEDAEVKKREFSKQHTRSHGDRSYGGGGWPTGQRAADQEAFIKAGEETDIYGLFSQAIQKGNIKVTTESTLRLFGNVEGDEYVMSATFSSKMYDRGASGLATHSGALFNPITVEDRKPFRNEETGEGYNPENFTVEKNITFFVTEGKESDMRIRRTGFIPRLMQKLAAEITSQINANDVIARMTIIAKNAANEKTEAV